MIKPEEERILILTPTGRDGDLTHQIISGSGLQSRVCADLYELCDLMTEGVGAIVLADEALTRSGSRCLTDLLDKQPSWSDIPLIVFPTNGANAEVLLQRLGTRANVMILDRPIRSEVFINAARSTLRARRRQYETRNLLLQLKHAHREKDLFLATLSHELRTPLNAILGWSRLLRSGELSADKAAMALEVIDRNATAQAQLIADILSVSQIIAGTLSINMEPVDLAEVVAAGIESLRPAAEAKRIHMEQSLPHRVWVHGDGGRLQQVVTNLLTNAVKFTPVGGKISVELQPEESSCKIVVRDTGKGISPEFLPHVFDRFQQADSSPTRAEGGLGLGLAIVEHLVKLHRGSIVAESEDANKGSTFTITLPRSSEGERHNESSVKKTPVLNGLHILAVDDDKESLVVLETTLQRYGATVVAVGSAAAALEAVKTERPDLLISDIAMPGLDGYELLRQLAAAIPDGSSIPAIALTGYASHKDRERALSAGYRLHVPKPFEPLELVRVIDQLRLIHKRPSRGYARCGVPENTSDDGL